MATLDDETFPTSKHISDNRGSRIRQNGNITLYCNLTIKDRTISDPIILSITNCYSDQLRYLHLLDAIDSPRTVNRSRGQRGESP